jgi:hypothetical protein
MSSRKWRVHVYLVQLTIVHASPKIGALDIDPFENSLYAGPSPSPRRERKQAKSGRFVW